MRSLVIGIDAATWRVIGPMVEQGRLPTIRRLMGEGTSGTLVSTVPPMTPLAWTSIATGVNPGKHGIYDFVAQDRHTYRVARVNLSRLTRPAIWDLFNACGKKVGVVNFPLAFPPPQVESFFVSGIGSPEDGEYAYPHGLGRSLKSQGYRIYARCKARDGAERYFKEVAELTDTQCELAIDLMKQQEWELFWVVFQGLDWIQHSLWSSSLDGDNAVTRFYCYMDEVIGRLLQQADQDWNIVVLSDHGFREIKGEIHLNNLLEEWGYLSRASTSGDKSKDPIVKVVRGLAKRLPLDLQRKVGRRVPEQVRDRLRAEPGLHQAVDWSHTRAFSFGYMGRIYIHEMGKYPQGTVRRASEYEALREVSSKGV